MFQLGQTMITPGACEALFTSGHNPADLLRRHQAGDWGDMDEDDTKANNRALKDGERIFSAYQVTPDLRVWVITEWDRSYTTVLLPDEY